MCAEPPCKKCLRCGDCVAECYRKYPVALTCPEILSRITIVRTKDADGKPETKIFREVASNNGDS